MGVDSATNQINGSSPWKKKICSTELDLDCVTSAFREVNIYKDCMCNTSASREGFIAALPDLTLAIHRFSEDRLWSVFNSPRNLLLALVGEIGELAEILQWKGDDDNGGSPVLTLSEHDKLSQELADVTIYLIHFAEACHVLLKNEIERVLTESCDKS